MHGCKYVFCSTDLKALDNAKTDVNTQLFH